MPPFQRFALGGKKPLQLEVNNGVHNNFDNSSFSDDLHAFRLSGGTGTLVSGSVVNQVRFRFGNTTFSSNVVLALYVGASTAAVKVAETAPFAVNQTTGEIWVNLLTDWIVNNTNPAEVHVAVILQTSGFIRAESTGGNPQMQDVTGVTYPTFPANASGFQQFNSFNTSVAVRGI